MTRFSPVYFMLLRVVQHLHEATPNIPCFRPHSLSYSKGSESGQYASLVTLDKPEHNQVINMVTIWLEGYFSG